MGTLPPPPFLAPGPTVGAMEQHGTRATLYTADPLVVEGFLESCARHDIRHAEVVMCSSDAGSLGQHAAAQADGVERRAGSAARALTLGVKQRGLPSERVHDHTSGIGYVAPHDGHYSDGLAKGNTILLLISEVFGGVNGTSLRFLTRLAHRFKSCKDVKYYDRGGREVSFFLHYARAISTAAAIGHARVLVKHAAGLNRRAALLRSGVRAAPSPAAVALADGLLNTLGAGTAAGRA